MKIRLFLKDFVKITFLKKIGLEKASWKELGLIWVPKKGPKRFPNRSTNGAKMASKNDQKIRSVFDRFGIDKKGWSPGTALQQRSGPEPWRG